MSVLIGVPSRGEVYAGTVSRLLEIQAKHLETSIIIETGKFGADETRHKIIKRFLEGSCETLLMIDDDVVPPLSILDMVGQMGTFSIMGAPYPISRPEFPIPIPCVFSMGPGGGWVPLKGGPFGRTGIVECEGIGAGCLAIKREVLEPTGSLGPAPFEVGRDGDGIITQSDDLAFCWRAKGAGIRIACHFDFQCEHRVRYVALGEIHRGYEAMYTKAMAKKGSVILP